MRRTKGYRVLDSVRAGVGFRLMLCGIGLTGCGGLCEDSLCTETPVGLESPTPTMSTPDAFADRVISFSPGEGAGFGQDQLPAIVLGPPVGAGQYSGSVDAVSLGLGGQIVVALDGLIVKDGDGIDLMIFENPFEIFEGNVYTEPGIVSVSEDGENWFEFPCDLTPPAYVGCAGIKPVYANESTGVSPLDPTVSGGDAFDLATVGLERARYIRIIDAGIGTLSAPATGFDLDAVAVIHGVQETSSPATSLLALDKSPSRMVISSRVAAQGESSR